MKLQHPRRFLTLISCALLGTAWAFTPPQDADVPITSHHVSGSVWYLEGRGGNIGVSAGDDGVLLIDDQFENMVGKIRAAVREIADRPLEFLINTHHHRDHTGGNALLGEEAVILAQENVRRRLVGDAQPKQALPVVTYSDGIGLHFNGESIRVIHVPNAHTDGDSVVWFRGSKVVHTGDLFFVDRFPYVDLDSGGSVEGLEQGLRKLLGELPDDIRIIPGHGPLSDKAGMERYLDMLVATRGLVADAIEAGQSAEDMKAANLLEAYAEWGTGFIGSDRFIDMLVRDLS